MRTRNISEAMAKLESTKTVFWMMLQHTILQHTISSIAQTPTLKSAAERFIKR